MARRFLSLVCPEIANDSLTKLVEWCDRYSPLAAADGSDGIILDITGCIHLFGDEGKLLLDVQGRLHRMGIESRGAIADAWGIAWALARYSKSLIVSGENAIAAFAPLPVEALRLPDEILLKLRRLGLTTISMVSKIPRRSIVTRFGPALLCRLDQAFHQAEEPLTPWRPPAPYRASRIVAEPIWTTGSLEYVLHDLLLEVCERLEKNHQGSRHIDLACYRVDETVDHCELRTSKPTRSIPHLMRLFADRLGNLRAGFGFETFVLSVLDVEALVPMQLALSRTDPVDDESSFDELIDRFGMRLGFQDVNRIRICESFLPEYAVEFRPASALPAISAEWPAYRLRPIQLIEPPMRIEVSILIPGESPVQFLAGQQRHRIVRSEGPERLASEWWRDKDPGWRTRDYYRIENERGFRFWIFRDSSERWFPHGHLP